MRSAIEVFGEWAQAGKDEKMADGHQLAVDNMLESVLAHRQDSFSMIDAGCGNGWVVRKVREHSLCTQAIGVDGAEENDHFWRRKRKVRPHRANLTVAITFLCILEPMYF